ncbi:MAG: hypothetical protein AAFX81_06740 [Pseudomonadota bacterium]
MTSRRWRGALAASGLLVTMAVQDAAAQDGAVPAPPDWNLEASRALFYAPGGGPVPLPRADSLRPSGGSVPAVVYVPSCSTPQSPDDHIPFLQELGVAVVVPNFGGENCVDQRVSYDLRHKEIARVGEVLSRLRWIDQDRVYLMGHAIGADVVLIYPDREPYRAVIGLAAACPVGLNTELTALTFRGLEDPVLANRNTRCTTYGNSNSLHLEFVSRDHMMRMTPSTPGGSPTLVGRAVAIFLGLAEPGYPMSGGPRLSDEDARDLRQLGNDD